MNKRLFSSTAEVVLAVSVALFILVIWPLLSTQFRGGIPQDTQLPAPVATAVVASSNFGGSNIPPPVPSYMPDSGIPNSIETVQAAIAELTALVAGTATATPTPTLRPYHTATPLPPEEVARLKSRNTLASLPYGIDGKIIARSRGLSPVSRELLRDFEDISYAGGISNTTQRVTYYMVQEITFEQPLIIDRVTADELYDRPGGVDLRSWCSSWPCKIERAWRVSLLGGPFGPDRDHRSNMGPIWGTAPIPYYWDVWLDDEPIGEKNSGIEGRLSMVILNSSLLREGARFGFSPTSLTTKAVQEIRYLDEPLHFLKPPTQ
ncbi:MAG: hypothetical protein M3441_07595 [Chloroflexota bacterium]|nr:hypothetical protein [Chloroflexota bacterium]